MECQVIVDKFIIIGKRWCTAIGVLLSLDTLKCSVNTHYAASSASHLFSQAFCVRVYFIAILASNRWQNGVSAFNYDGICVSVTQLMMVMAHWIPRRMRIESINLNLSATIAQFAMHFPCSQIHYFEFNFSWRHREWIFVQSKTDRSCHPLHSHLNIAIDSFPGR